MSVLIEKNILQLIERHCKTGRMGFVIFEKKDKTLRKMWFTKIQEHQLTHPGLESNPVEGLCKVYDIRAKGIRSFKLANVQKLSIGGESYVR